MSRTAISIAAAAGGWLRCLGQREQEALPLGIYGADQDPPDERLVHLIALAIAVDVAVRTCSEDDWYWLIYSLQGIDPGSSYPDTCLAATSANVPSVTASDPLDLMLG